MTSSKKKNKREPDAPTPPSPLPEGEDRSDEGRGYSRWNEFFNQYGYTAQITRLATLYPQEKSVTVKYSEIDEFDDSLALALEDNPDAILKKAEDSMMNIIVTIAHEAAAGMRVHFRVKDLPRNARIGVRNIREKEINKLIVVEGIAKRVTEVKPKALVAAFRCARCHQLMQIPQPTPFMQTPLECDGCHRVDGSTRFHYDIGESTLIDSQKIEVMERPEGLRGGSQPQALVCHAYEDLCGFTSPGDKVIMTGVLRAVPKDQKHTTHDTYMDVLHIELVDVETEEIEITDAERLEINRLAAIDNIQDILTESLSPSLFGMSVIKRAVLLQLFGGVSKITPDGTRLRGDIHVLLIGDPGTGKSQLIRYMASITPRGVYASGKSSSSAGLTACATKDEFGEGKWTLEAGAMVLADGGLCVVDELDKMGKDDRSSMHEAMEQQTISVNKASIHSTLQSRCAVLAAANPKFGRFMPDALIVAQIDLPPTLFSRFDLIFPITDKPNTQNDGNIAEHILNCHLTGQARKRTEGSIAFDRSDRMDTAEKAVKPVVPVNILRKYVFLAKKLVPMLTEDAIRVLKAYYQEVRSMGLDENSPVPITARQLEGLVRLAEASAKSRMSDKVEERDALCSVSIVQEFLDRVVSKSGGSGGFDIDALSGHPKSQRDMMQVINSVSTELSRNGVFSYSMFEEECINKGIDSGRVSEIFDRMVRDGEIYLKTTKENKKYYLKV